MIRSAQPGFLAIVTAAAGLLCAGAQHATQLTFQVRASELLRQASSFAKNKRPADSVTVTLPGKLYDPPLIVPLIERQQADWSTPEGAIASVRSANTANDHAWIVQNFVPAERDEIQKLLDYGSVEERNQAYYQTVRKVEIIGTALFKGYTILLVQDESSNGSTRKVALILTNTAEGWKQSNALSEDDTVDVVSAAWRAGIVR